LDGAGGRIAGAAFADHIGAVVGESALEPGWTSDRFSFGEIRSG